MPLVCSTTELVCACPANLARLLVEQTAGLCAHPLPFPTPSFSVSLAFDPSRHDEPELTFLRSEVAAVLTG